MALFIYLFFFLFSVHTESKLAMDIFFPSERQLESEQVHLLKVLNEMPVELEITDPVHLEAIEGFIKRTEMVYDSQIVVEFMATIKRAVTPVAAYMKGAEAIRKLHDDFENSLTQTQQQTLLITIAELNNWAINHEVAFEMLQEMLPEIDDIFLRGWAYSTIAGSEYRLGRYNDAIEHYLNALSIFLEIDDKPRIAEVNNGLGNLYFSIDEFNTSNTYYQRHIDMAAEAGDERALANGYLNIGAAYSHSGDSDKAFEAYGNGIELSEKIGNVMEIARAKMHIANLYAEKQRIDEALQSYRESLDICEEYGIEYGVMINQLNIGKLYFQENRFEDSEEAYLASYELMNRENNKLEMLSVTELLAELYEAMGDYQNAFSFLKIYDEINGEIFDSEKLKMTEDLRFRYETELKEQDLARAELMIGKQKLQNRIFIILIVSLAIVLVSGYVYYRKRNEYYRRLNKKNVDLLTALGIDNNSLMSAKKAESDEKDISDSSDELYQKVKALFTEEKIYRKPSLQLSHIAKKVGSNRKYVSQAIKTNTQMSFNSYLNFYRVIEAKRMILDGEGSMGDIQFACGFNSRTTFYSSFKENTGMSPTKFKEMKLQESLEE